MITLNLMSPDHKQELKVKRIYIMIKEIVMLFLLFTIIIAILLLTSKYVLESELTRLIKRNATTIAHNQELNQEILKLNTVIDRVNQIQSNYHPLSGLLSELADLTPTDVKYDFIKIHRTEASLELQGTAQTRQALITLEESLQASDLLTAVSLPLDNKLAKENNEFRIRAEINLSQLK